MNWTPVTSRNLKAVAYDDGAKILTIAFVSGRVYAYSNVPAEIADALVNAESVGKYFSAEIRGKYTETEIKTVPDETEKP